MLDIRLNSAVPDRYITAARNLMYPIHNIFYAYLLFLII